MKIALGTAQFGINHALHQRTGFTQAEIMEIFELALDKSINCFDSSIYYGKSDELIGTFINQTHSKINVISKINGGEKNAFEIFENVLKSIQQKQLYAFMIHNYYSFVDNPTIWKELSSLKENGRVRKIGFSLYFPEELENLWQQSIEPDIIQIPYNLFDRRFEPLFPEIKQRATEVHVRSTFASGYVFQQPDNSQSKLEKATTQLHNLSNEFNLSIAEICINFAALNKHIDKIVMGVESISDLNKNISALDQQSKVLELMDQLNELKLDDVSELLPNESKYQNYTLLN